MGSRILNYFMKAGTLYKLILITVFTISFQAVLLLAEPVQLNLRPSGSKVQLSWPASVMATNQSMVFPAYQVQCCSDLSSWSSLPGIMRGMDGLGVPYLSRWLDKLPGPIFYRVRANTNPGALGATADGGEAIFGYNDVLATELEALDLL